MSNLKKELQNGLVAVAMVCAWPLVATVCGDSIHDVRLATSYGKFGTAVKRLERIRQST